MDKDEFCWALQNPSGVFLVAEVDGNVGGFVYFSADGKDKPLQKKWARLIYLVVAPELRGHKVATQFYDACITELKEKGITHLYGWAHTEGDGWLILQGLVQCKTRSTLIRSRGSSTESPRVSVSFF